MGWIWRSCSWSASERTQEQQAAAVCVSDIVKVQRHAIQAIVEVRVVCHISVFLLLVDMSVPSFSLLILLFL
jgi:hypothetical protein